MSDKALHGVKLQDRRARPEAARKLARELAQRGEVAYWTVPPEGNAHEDWRGDQRPGPRQPTRLRSAKLR